MFEIFANKQRTSSYSGSIFESDSTTPVALAAGDVLRFKIGRAGDIPLLDLDSGSPTSSGSEITIDGLGAEEDSDTEGTPAAYTIRLAQDDLASIPQGVYDCELAIVDVSLELAGEPAILHVERGVLHLLSTMN